jgi:Haloacid dehalogenase-like hydrolase
MRHFILTVQTVTLICAYFEPCLTLVIVRLLREPRSLHMNVEEENNKMNTAKAIIFDLDGVLTDTSEYHYQAWKHLADDEGIPFTHKENDVHLRGVG